MTVEWSLPPSSRPTWENEMPVSCLKRYMANFRAKAVCLSRFRDLSSVEERLKLLATAWIIRSGVGGAVLGVVAVISEIASAVSSGVIAAPVSPA